ncbi:MAG: SusD family protein [Mucilaginibacter sp.]|nr:SusD family protein [Mucilaginibacter sp.]
MKKIYFPVILALLFMTSLMMVSCKKNGFLAPTTTTNLSQNTIFTDSANAEGFLANIYSNIGFSTSASRFAYTDPTGTKIPCGGLDAACDESEPSHSYSTTALAFATGTINAGIVTDDAYNTCYNNIRAVNQLLKNLSKIPIKPVNKLQMKGEARFLRAWYYAILLEHYGGVPLIGDTLYTYTDHIPVVRGSYAACVNYITSECDSAASILPLTQSGLNYGRASKGACLALKARVLLYAASPLFNGTTLDIGNVQQLVGYPSYDVTRWKLAEDAAAAVISLGAYSLNLNNTPPGYGFQSLFPMRYNSEYIFQLMRPQNADLENLFNPPSRTGGNGAFPYQQMVDAFPMSNGKAITDPTSGYNPNNPYANRDPRLYYSIIYDQSLLGVRTANGQVNSTAPVNIFVGSYNGLLTGQDAVHQGTITGYYNNKMLDPNCVANAAQAQTARCIPLIRYAEVLLNYAEAANEFEGPTAQVYQAVESIRQRAGLNPYQLPVGLSQADMRLAIRNERRIELAYEGHRFFDVRRWMIADQTDNLQMTGMEVDRSGAAVTYNIFNVRKHNFRKAMYLWPFPLSETGKSPQLIQNPGY